LTYAQFLTNVRNEEFLLRDEVATKKLQIITPSDPNQRGCQLSLRFEVFNNVHMYCVRMIITSVRQNEQAKGISEKLLRGGVVCDLRKPDVIRVSPTPLYNNFTDVWEFVTVLKTILSE